MNGRDWSTEIDVLVGYLTEYYLFPDVAERTSLLLRQRLADGAYREAMDEESFAAAVTQDTLAASGDQHLRVRYSVAPIPERAVPVVPESGRHPEEARLSGHGFAKVQRLPGNVGLLDIRRFFPASMSGRVATGAMHLIADTDALIVDLRENWGGEPDMVSLLCSFLVDERTHLNDLHFPATDTTIQYWTEAYVPGPIFGGTKPVYVLTSRDTISGGEEFAYDLQQLGRATLIGETTAGAANFDYRYRVSDHLMFSVPSGGPVNPVSGKGWEGIGIEPDISVSADLALDTAYKLALQHVLELGAEGYRRPIANEAVHALAALEATGRHRRPSTHQ